ncbi:class I SAM-dependent methyltransferase [Nocardioides sp. zg-DK7169]|uniref:class I SAM-dependent methyltransferase n=1 Tax=Nocardioides sp. zg-DK7169 TaxID=2736600 RepID=UPI0015522212|nr:class I SAM-dependent methyltransferase [Nocardioides sp. zg-DK7169]NPC97772.1 class I SAM-dependent methyltransferase [Nocardioides sp. zg-DK7169]
MTTETTRGPGPADPGDAAVKEKHRVMWASGDYPRLVTDLITDLGPALVAAAGLGPGDRVLDVAAGTGNASLPAARAGAEVTASDLTPELLEAGRRVAEAEGLALTWDTADAERLPYDDESFDAVISCVGHMFAPRHEATARELVRVCRRDGTIALLSWTPQGFIGQVFATMRPYAPPPPPGAQPPPLWGEEGHLAEMLGADVADVRSTRRTVAVDHFADGAQWRDYFKAVYGPTIAAYRHLADDEVRTAELDGALAELPHRFGVDPGPMHWEYLLTTARRT